MAAALGRMIQRGLVAGYKLAPANQPMQCRLAMAPVLSQRLFSTRRAAKPIDVEEDFDDEGYGQEQASVMRRIMAMKDVQKEYDTINVDFQKELALLQAKYLEKYQPLFDKRRDIALGKVEVGKYDIEDDGEADNGIPEFWLTCLMNNEKVGPFITERDSEVLKHLVDIRVKVLTGEDRGFELTFHFEPNQYFENKTLTKTYMLEPEDDVVPKKLVGTQIQWKDEKLNPTVEQKKKRVKGKEAGKGGKPSFTIETTPCESFFYMFDPPEIPTNPETLDDEELEALQEEISSDFEIGFSIKDSIIPRAVEWFTGELADPYMDDGEGYEDEEFEEEPEPEPRRGGKGYRG